MTTRCVICGKPAPIIRFGVDRYKHVSRPPIASVPLCRYDCRPPR